MKTLKEYKKRCPSQWKEATAYRILMVLFFEDKESKGLKTDKLKKMTELPEDIFRKTMGFLNKTKEITFNESSVGRRYFLGNQIKNSLDSFYNYL